MNDLLCTLYVCTLKSSLQQGESLLVGLKTLNRFCYSELDNKFILMKGDQRSGMYDSIFICIKRDRRMNNVISLINQLIEQYKLNIYSDSV